MAKLEGAFKRLFHHQLDDNVGKFNFVLNDIYLVLFLQLFRNVILRKIACFSIKFIRGGGLKPVYKNFDET